MNMKKLMAIILAISVLLVGCTSTSENSTFTNNEDSKSSAGTNSKYINLTMVEPTTINPILNTDKSVGYIMNLVYDGLFTIDQDYNIVPQLVSEYSIASDGKSMNLILKDAKWHDGSSITSSDVKYTIELIQANTSSPYNTLIENISSVNIINNKEFNIYFKGSYAFSKDTLIFPIVSKKALEGSEGNKILENSKNLIGNGKYKIESMNEREGMTLVVNSDYYEELPKGMRDINVSIIPNEEAQVSMVLSLDSDIAKISLGDLSQFYEDQFNTMSYEGRDYDAIIFNYDKEYIQDENFRKALAYAIDRGTILDEAYIGNAKLVNFPLHTKSKFYDSKLNPLDYDKAKAESYLGKINLGKDNEIINDSKNETINNVTDNETTNSTQKKDGVDDSNELTDKERKNLIDNLNLKIIVNKNNAERTKAASIVSENLEAIGINSTIEALDDEEMENAIVLKDYDLAFVGWELSSVPDVKSIIESTGFADEKLTNYINSLQSATSDTQIKTIYSQMQKYIRDKVAFISLVIRDDYLVTNRRLEGKSEPNDFDIYEGIDNYTIKNK